MEAEVLEDVWWQNVIFRTVSVPGLGIFYWKRCAFISTVRCS